MPADLSRRAGDAVRELVRLGALRSAWVPGMLWRMPDGQAARIMRGGHGPDSYPGWFTSERSLRWSGDAHPDTDDPLTVFGLLLFAREAWGEPTLSVQSDGGEWWCGSAFATERGHGTTEAEAIVAAIEAAVEARRG